MSYLLCLGRQKQAQVLAPAALQSLQSLYNLYSLTLTSKQNSAKSSWLLIFGSLLSQRKYAIVLHLSWKIHNCSRVQTDFLRQCSGQRQHLWRHAFPSLSSIWLREHWNTSSDILYLLDPQHKFSTAWNIIIYLSLQWWRKNVQVFSPIGIKICLYTESQ